MQKKNGAFLAKGGYACIPYGLLHCRSCNHLFGMRVQLNLIQEALPLVEEGAIEGRDFSLWAECPQCSENGTAAAWVGGPDPAWQRERERRVRHRLAVRALLREHKAEAFDAFSEPPTWGGFGRAPYARAVYVDGKVFVRYSSRQHLKKVLGEEDDPVHAAAFGRWGAELSLMPLSRQEARKLIRDMDRLV